MKDQMFTAWPGEVDEDSLGYEYENIEYPEQNTDSYMYMGSHPHIQTITARYKKANRNIKQQQNAKKQKGRIWKKLWRLFQKTV